MAEPWGTPQDRGVTEEIAFPMTTGKVLFGKGT